MRKFTDLATNLEKKLLGTLSDPQTNTQTYRDTMLMLGERLASKIAEKIRPSEKIRICVACTAEDADFLAKGLLDGFAKSGIDQGLLNLVCFWNGRFNAINTDDDEYDIAPIVKQYREAFPIEDSFLVVVKSIISSACVVKTNLSSLIEETKPRRIFVAAPVMFKDAEKRLASEFAGEVSKSFEYLTFALDDQKSEDGKVVLPGVGGSVYERLGVGDVMKLVPEIVKSRRRSLSTVE